MSSSNEEEKSCSRCLSSHDIVWFLSNVVSSSTKIEIRFLLLWYCWRSHIWCSSGTAGSKLIILSYVLVNADCIEDRRILLVLVFMIARSFVQSGIKKKMISWSRYRSFLFLFIRSLFLPFTQIYKPDADRYWQCDGWCIWSGLCAQ